MVSLESLIENIDEHIRNKWLGIFDELNLATPAAPKTDEGYKAVSFKLSEGGFTSFTCDFKSLGGQALEPSATIKSEETTVPRQITIYRIDLQVAEVQCQFSRGTLYSFIDSILSQALENMKTKLGPSREGDCYCRILPHGGRYVFIVNGDTLEFRLFSDLVPVE